MSGLEKVRTSSSNCVYGGPHRKSCTPRLLMGISDMAPHIKMGPPSESRARACAGLSVRTSVRPLGQGTLVQTRISAILVYSSLAFLACLAFFNSRNAIIFGAIHLHQNPKKIYTNSQWGGLSNVRIQYFTGGSQAFESFTSTLSQISIASAAKAT